MRALCLEKDRDAPLTFYDFPAELWVHIRTTNPIESAFSTVRLRTAKVRSCFSSKTVLTMAFKLCQCAEKKWIKLHHPKRIPEVIRGVKFFNGVAAILIMAFNGGHQCCFRLGFCLGYKKLGQVRRENCLRLINMGG